MSLVKLIAQADERGLAAGGLACFDRCLPLVPDGADVLRPLWADLAAGPAVLGARLAEAKAEMAGVRAGANVEAALVLTMLASAPEEWAAVPLRVWADTCSLISLEIHQRLDTAGEGVRTAGPEQLERCRAYPAARGGRAEVPDGTGPLVSGELRRQIRILEILADTADTGALRRAIDLSNGGQRVTRAVVSRRARAQRQSAW